MDSHRTAELAMYFGIITYGAMSAMIISGIGIILTAGEYFTNLMEISTCVAVIAAILTITMIAITERKEKPENQI